jgi:aconitate hydratase
MMRGTFANIRLRNLMAPGTEGGVTIKLPEGTPMSIFDAAMAYAEEGTPLIILGGKEYGSGSSRDWAAKGTKLLGVRAVLVESFERIHRSNLVGMGVLPLQYLPGESAETLGLSGTEVVSITGLEPLNHGETVHTVTVHVTRDDGTNFTFDARLRIDTPTEAEYYRHGGVLNFVLRQLAAS